MSNAFHEQPQPLPTSAIQNVLSVSAANWFEYPVTVYPHHTDYAGVVWHGTYLTWMEAARIECLQSIGVSYADLVELGCELPVVEMSIRYHQSVLMGAAILVKTRMTAMEGVRMNWDYQIQSTDGQVLFLTARVALVAVDREKRKILRQLPPVVQNALAKLSGVQ